VAEAAGVAARAEALFALQALHVERGDAEAAQDAIRRLEALVGQKEAPPDLAARASEARIGVALRLEKDFEGALRLLDRHEEAFPDGDDLAYERAWCLARSGRVTEALALAERAFLADGDVDGLETFAYLAFRAESPPLLARANAALRDALSEHPEKTASLSAALARVLRRQGQLREAEALFARAVGLAGDADRRVTYEGQLDHVREEIAAAFPPEERKALSLQFVGYEPQGPISFTFAMFVLPGALVLLAIFFAILLRPLEG
jgi:tetratricopeptide (TPR) repeat protein